MKKINYVRQYINKLSLFLIILIIFSFNSKSQDLIDGYYYFIDETQLISCNQDLMMIFNISNPSLKNKIKYVLISKSLNNIDEIQNYFDNLIIVDTFNIIASKFGIINLPTMLKIKNNEIDLSFVSDYMDTYGKKHNFNIKKHGKLTDLRDIDYFIKFKNYYVFYDETFKNVLFYNLDNQKTYKMNMMKLYLDYLKNTEDEFLLEMMPFAKYNNGFKGFYINNNGLNFKLNMCDSVFLRGEVGAISSTPVSNDYDITIKDFEKSNYEISKSKVKYEKIRIEDINDSIFKFGEHIFEFKNFEFDRKSIYNYELQLLEDKDSYVLFTTQIKKDDFMILESMRIITRNYYKNNRYIRSENVLLPYTWDSTPKIIPVSLENGIVKNFLLHNTEGWIEIDHYVDFESQSNLSK